MEISDVTQTQMFMDEVRLFWNVLSTFHWVSFSDFLPHSLTGEVIGIGEQVEFTITLGKPVDC